MHEDEDSARASEASLLGYGGRGQTSTCLDATGAKLNANDTPSELERFGFEGLVSLATEYQQHKSDPFHKSKKESLGSLFPVRSPDGSGLPRSNRDSNILDDEAYARQLAQEEERNVTNSLLEATRATTSQTNESSKLPLYETTNRDGIARTEIIEKSSSDGMTSTSMPVSNVSHLPIQPNPVLLVPPTSPLSSHTNPPSYTETTPPNRTDAPRVTILMLPTRNIHGPHFDGPREAQSSSEPSAQGFVNANSFVDKKLFIGVSKYVFLLMISSSFDKYAVSAGIYEINVCSVSTYANHTNARRHITSIWPSSTFLYTGPDLEASSQVDGKAQWNKA